MVVHRRGKPADRKAYRLLTEPNSNVILNPDMTRQFTDAENTGMAAVPNLNSTDEPGQRRETMEEAVWSHRLPITEDRQ